MCDTVVPHVCKHFAKNMLYLCLKLIYVFNNIMCIEASCQISQFKRGFQMRAERVKDGIEVCFATSD